MKNLALKVSGVIFLVVAVGHLVRFALEWDLIIGPWDVPMSASLYAGIGIGVLAVWALMVSRNA